MWGREIVHVNLQTTGGPTWKPLPVIFTTLFAPFGKRRLICGWSWRGPAR